jgi:HAD superfamily hydrolase (TIGR01509 family)
MEMNVGDGARMLSGCRHWVFDMDGTLTEATHDFVLIRRELGMPAEVDILQYLAALPQAQAQAKHAWLLAHERELAQAARPAPGALALLRQLHADGCQLGLLTRNTRTLARLTLDVVGAGAWFADADLIGRDELRPKPAPDGLGYFQQRWGVGAAQLLMVGDHLHDLACGRAAGVRTVLLGAPADAWPGMADVRLRGCAELLACRSGPAAG